MTSVNTLLTNFFGILVGYKSRKRRHEDVVFVKMKRGLGFCLPGSLQRFKSGFCDKNKELLFDSESVAAPLI